MILNIHIAKRKYSYERNTNKAKPYRIDSQVWCNIRYTGNRRNVYFDTSTTVFFPAPQYASGLIKTGVIALSIGVVGCLIASEFIEVEL